MSTAYATADSLDLPSSAGWFTDPTGCHRMRYFDGNGWTDHVTHFGPQPCAGCGDRSPERLED